jgi:hypothetical protein
LAQHRAEASPARIKIYEYAMPLQNHDWAKCGITFTAPLMLMSISSEKLRSLTSQRNALGTLSSQLGIRGTHTKKAEPLIT